MNDEIPKWMQVLLKNPVKIGWKIYCFFFFRGMMVKHYFKRDITLGKLFYLFLPAGMRPKNFDYYQ